MKAPLITALASVAASCPFAKLKSSVVNPHKLSTAVFSTEPQPENIPEGGYKLDVTKVPALLRDEDAFLGILGPCSNYGLY